MISNIEVLHFDLRMKILQDIWADDKVVNNGVILSPVTSSGEIFLVQEVQLTLWKRGGEFI